MMAASGVNQSQKRRQKSYNNNMHNDNSKGSKVKSQKLMKEMIVGVNVRKGSMYIDGSLDKNLKLSASIHQEAIAGGHAKNNSNVDKSGSRGSIQSLNNYNNAAGLIYYKKADTTSVINNRPQ